VIHFSDTHINFTDIEELYTNEHTYAAGVRRYARFPQAVPSFYATLDYAAAQEGTLLAHTGDLIDFGTRASYNFLRHNLKGLNFIYAIGNHEYEFGDTSYDPDIAFRRRRLVESGIAQNIECHSRIVNGVNFVAFDNAVLGRGIVNAGTRKAIEGEFEKKFPVVLMCHIPPYSSHEFNRAKVQGRVDLALQHGREVNLDDYQAKVRGEIWAGDDETVAFWKRIRERENFKAVLCGHCHWAWDEPFGCGRICMAGGNFEGCLNEIDFI
jgi:3',5'-cyclic AMP phosphodiesterase CpdA